MNFLHLAPGNALNVKPYEPVKARLATWSEQQQDTLAKLPQSVNTAWCALSHGHAKDHALGRLDDTCRTLGVATIAGLGSLGLSQAGGALPLVLGGLSWLAAMAITPQIINALVWLKTGVNLGTQYRSSNGEIRPLFQDPNYMPLQVLPLEKRIQLADNLGIPKPHPDRVTLLQTKLKQITVQAHTWWMLMAGMATPVLASTICDQLETPLKNLSSRLWTTYTQKMVVQPALQTKQASHLGEALQKMAEAVLGSGTELTAAARWWQQLPGEIIKALKLDTLPQSVMTNPSATKRFNAIAAHLAKTLPTLSAQDALQTALHHQQQSLASTLAPLENLLAKAVVKRHAPQAVVAQVSQQLNLARETAEATLNHLGELIHLPWKSLNSSQRIAHVKQAMEKRILPYVEQLNRTGHISRARQMAGGASFFNRVFSSFSSGRFAPAFSQMGDSPKSFLNNAVRSLGLRRQWVKWFPGLIGVGMLVATGAFVAWGLGEEPKKRGGKA